MHYAGRESWRISEDQGWELTVALYVRDAAGLESPGYPSIPPALEPAVGVNATLGPVVSGLRADWRVWWSALLQQRRKASRAADPREWIRGTAPSVEFESLLDDLLPSAYAWAERRKGEHIKQFQTQTRPQRLAINQIVQSVQQDLGRTARPFRMHITSLSVSGRWSEQISDSEFLVSRHLRYDPVELDHFLRPVITALA